MAHSTSRTPGPVLRRLLRLPVLLYRWRLGWLLGGRFLLLVHAGRRTGREYRTVVEVVGHDRATDEWRVMAGFGRTADWYRNVMAGGAVRVVAGRTSFAPVVRELDEDAAVQVLAAYERRNRAVAPVVRAVLSRLAGRRYTATDADRRRLVQQLPIVGFRPTGTAS